jgi:signal transduction histidine kinase
MARFPFNVSAYTARLIGRENVSRLESAILELVKNAYDADATVCALYYEDSTGTLYIADNGTGMTEEVILRHWMTIGNSSKVESFRSPSGRIQTGAKGIGRFALDRISDRSVMFTTSSNSKLEWKVNWSDFDTRNAITEIYADLNQVHYDFNNFVRDAKNIYFKELINKYFNATGTVFKLASLRDAWTDKLINDIRNNLQTLIPPEYDNMFKIYLFTEYSNLKNAKVNLDDGLFSFDYKIEFNAIDEDVYIQIFRNEFDFKSEFEKIIKGAKFTKEDERYFKGEPIIYNKKFYELLPSKEVIRNTIGSFSGVLYFVKLSAQKDEKDKFYYKDFGDRKQFMDSFGGIKIYRDNFRVRPYGEPKTSNYDWLLLSNRKTKSPAAVSHKTGKWRVNSDQMMGSIYISRTNLTLPDQANREGIVETREFSLLKEFILSIIQLFENDRQYVARKLNELYEATHYVQQIENEIRAKIKVQNAQKQKNRSKKQVVELSKVQTVIESKDTVIRELEDENRLLRTLATTGIVTNTYIHEIKGSSHRLGLKIKMAKDALELDDDKNLALKYINEADQIKDSFNSWFKVTVESVRRDKRTMRKVNIKSLLEELIESWGDITHSKNIVINLDVDLITFRCFPYEVETIINNLITNSITSFENGRVPKKEISIKVSKLNEELIIEYSDTGIGLSPAYKKEPEKILESFESDKRNDNGEVIGTGMGMWIVNKTVSNYNGKIDLSKNILIGSGFHIRIAMKEKSGQ